MDRLATITGHVAQRLEQAKQETPRSRLEHAISSSPPPPDFHQALRNGKTPRTPAVIAELKRASPSKGLIRPHFPVEELARELEAHGAHALSVLTECDHFQGAPEFLRTAARSTAIPILRKDFIIDDYQLLEARSWGASAALLIVALLTPGQLQHLLQQARNYGLATLVETHDEAELRIALDAGASIIGVNSRNLKTFQTDLAVAERMIAHIPGHLLRVAESGIHTTADVHRLHQAGADAILVGENLMRAEHPGQQLEALLEPPA